MTAPSPSNQQRAAELAEALNTHPEAWVVHRALPVVLAAEARSRAEAAAKIREIADTYERHSGLMRAQTESTGVRDTVERSQAFSDAAATLRALAADLTAPADRSAS